MGIEELAPSNTRKAKQNAVKAFMKFLQDEDVNFEHFKGCMLRDSAPQAVIAVLDKFGMHLTFRKGRRSQPLSRNSVMQYFRQAKVWLLDQFPQHRPAVESRLLKMGSTLERYCMKRVSGGYINKAVACTKGNLRQMVTYLYSNAASPADYQDAALLCLLWFLFGRASDLTLLRKPNLSISAGDIFFIRFVRMKTAEEQGLSLFPDADLATCPLLAIALALAKQVSPSAALLNQLPEQQSAVNVTVPTMIPLIDLLDHPPSCVLADGTAGTESVLSPQDNVPGIHSYVNRLLDRLCKPSGIDEHLTSHSFRRGGAQHANSSASLSAQWIFDRGAWNMTTTNKAFAYVFNTPSEDHKVAKVLSGYKPDDDVVLDSLDSFDAQTQIKIREAMGQLFNSCKKLESKKYNVNLRVLEVLMAYLIRHYPTLKLLNVESPAIKRLEDCVVATGTSLAELLAWSAHIGQGQAVHRSQQSENIGSDKKMEEHAVIRQQAALIDQLVQMNKRLDQRLNAMEASLDPKRQITAPSQERDEPVSEPPRKRRRTAAVTYLREVWYTWYTQEPRLWSKFDAQDQKKKSDSKLLVAFMKLFLDNGFTLDEKSNRYRDDVLEVGAQAENSVLSFLRVRGITSRGSNAVLKRLRDLHKQGHLNNNIRHYRQLIARGAIADPAPDYTQNILEVETSTVLPTSP